MIALNSRLAAFAASRNAADQGQQFFEGFEKWFSEIPFSARKEVLFAFVGGSVAKGTSNHNSDLDVTLVTEYCHEQALSLFLSSPPILALGNRQNVRLDIRIVSKSNLLTKIDAFGQALDVSIALQDFLWNLRFGLYLGDKPLGIIEKIGFIYEKNSNPLVFQAMQTRLRRMVIRLRDSIQRLRFDQLQITEARLQLMKLALLYSFNELEEGFWGYKNTHLVLEALPNKFREIIIACTLCADGDPQTISKLAQLSKLLPVDIATDGAEIG